MKKKDMSTQLFTGKFKFGISANVQWIGYYFSELDSPFDSNLRHFQLWK